MVKKAISSLVLLLMLRVWFNANNSVMSCPCYESGEGILLNPTYPVFSIRLDNGRLTGVWAGNIFKSKWVEVKPEK